MSLENIRIVLVRPTHPGNIGASARAMKNMGLATLYLVAPRQFPHPEATARAAEAGDVLARAAVCDTLDEALRDCRLAIGTSARARRIEWPALAPEACAERLLADAAQGPVALLFGQERTGLTNDELDRCHSVVSIPVDPGYPSLNLACAVQILAYELRRRRLAATPAAGVPVAAVSQEQMRNLYEHLERVLVGIDFLDPGNPRLLMRRLTRLFNRAGPDQNEINILRGILTAVQKKAGLE
jgi:TrmH family RNA methyltransferase